MASASAQPFVYSYGTFPYGAKAAYTAAELYKPAAVAPLSAAFSAGYPTTYSSAYTSYPVSYTTPLSGQYTTSLPLSAVSAYGSAYNVEGLAALYNPVSALSPVAPLVSAPLAYASPYSYVSQLYK